MALVPGTNHVNYCHHWRFPAENGPFALMVLERNETGIEAGVEIDRQPVRSADELRNALQKAGDRPALVQVNRQGRTIFLPFRTR